MSVRLVVEDGPLAGRCFELSDGSRAVGRHGADVSILQDRYLDDDHAVVEILGAEVTVRDLHSIHGTFVNGSRITEAPLHDGDVVQFGTTRLRLEAQTEPGALSCPGCGLGLGATPPAVCPRCGRDLAALVRGDLPASQPRAAYCVACGKQLPPAARFCPACGHDAQQLAAPGAPAAARSALPTWLFAVLSLALVLMVLLLAGGGFLVGRLAKAAAAGAATAELPPSAGEASTTGGATAGTAPSVPDPRTATASPELPAAGGASAAGSGWRQSGRVRLRYGGAPGQRLSYETSTAMSGNIQVAGQSMPLDVQAGSTYDQEIISNDGGRLAMRLQLNPWGVRQDGQPFGGALPSAPAPMTVTMSPTGEILAVQQAAGSETSLVPGLPNGLSFDYRSIVQHLSGMAFPDRELAVGDEWTRNATAPLPNGGSIAFQARSRLDGFTRVAGRDVARIVTDLVTPVTMNLSGDDRQPVETVGSLNGQVTSYFDPDEGALVRSESDMAMQFSMAAAGAAGANAGGDSMAGITQALQGLQSLYGSMGEEGGTAPSAPAMPALPDPAQSVRLEASGSVKTVVIRKR